MRRAALVLAFAAIPAAVLYQQNQMASLRALRAAHSTVNGRGRQAIVAGATSGIGRGIAVRLGQAGFDVTVVGRDAARGAEVVHEITAGGGTATFWPVDAMLLGNIRDFSEKWAASHDKLDVLVLTQGMATIQGRTETAEGVDQKLALHYFGRMAFADQLLPLLRKGTAPKVLSVLSAGVHGVYPHWDDDFELKTHYSLKNAADAAGFYNDLALDAMARAPGNEGMAFIHAAPGFVATNWGTEMPWWLRGPIRALQASGLGTTIQDCAEYLLDPVFKDDTRGLVLIGARAQPAAKTPQHDQARDVVWGKTRALLDARLKR